MNRFSPSRARCLRQVTSESVTWLLTRHDQTSYLDQYGTTLRDTLNKLTQGESGLREYRKRKEILAAEIDYGIRAATSVPIGVPNWR